MPLDWFSKAGSSESVAELLARKRYAKALERLRGEFERGNRSVGLRLQYADVLAQAGQADHAIPVLLGLASELQAAGALARAQEVVEQAERLQPGRTDVARKREALRPDAPPPVPAEERPADDEVATEWFPEESAGEGSPLRVGAREEGPAAFAAEPLEVEDFDADLAETRPAHEAPPVLPPLSVPGAGNDAVDIFGPALAPPSLGMADLATAPPHPSCVEAALADVEEAAVVGDVWVAVEGEAAPEVMVAELAGEPSVADIAEMAVDEAATSKGSLVTYIRDLAARFAPAEGERPGLLHLSALLFDGLPEGDLREKLPGLGRRDFDPGAAMVREGEPGDSLFLLARGSARVLVQGAHGRRFEVALLPEGSFFGEISMVGGLRTATVEAVGPCETLEVARPTLEELAHGRPFVQEVVEQAMLERASSLEVEAVRAVPAMDAETPGRALALFDAHFGLRTWTSRTRFRLAELLARTGHYVDVVPVLVGLADRMQATGQPARALAVLRKVAVLGVRATPGLQLPALTRRPGPAHPAPPAAVVTYVEKGQPTPAMAAVQEFRAWLQLLMAEARGEGPGEVGGFALAAERPSRPGDVPRAAEAAPC